MVQISKRPKGLELSEMFTSKVTGQRSKLNGRVRYVNLSRSLRTGGLLNIRILILKN